MLAARRRGHPLRKYIDERDLLLTGVATQKLSRLIAKEKLMAFARAPFTELEGKGDRPSSKSGPAAAACSAR